MRKLAIGAAALVLGLGLAPRAQALTTAFVDFENNPHIAQGPSLFADAGNAQTIVVPGVATFTGGVVLGDETNLPALSFATAPNVYGTALNTFIGSTFVLPDQITITINPSFTVKEVSFPFFNGVLTTASFTVDAFNGTTQIGQQLLTNIPANTDSGHAVVDLTTATDITSVVITPDSITPWDFSIDSVAFNEAVSQAITPGGTPIPPASGVPLPSSAWMSLALLAGLGAFGAIRSRLRHA
jgi:hypothetical protein